ncbi:MULTISPECIES: sensor domain-containing diguanylate cyclase [unclassified Ensifer]|uniref:GGDEF domain-containing protein n=1 Tax=unclassified Ensifer TaxID=2633371 RepID=UPI000813D239|nr:MULTISPECIES: sensor domain-containing diguanylate cyclase [unclassified Ensifer]OCP00530.1 diguanylate cyclase [Ensifer sp. LC14]OCP05898.1 diguanylate cyclase [Ensifer sp. LC11]OCP06649.1 diguanylate cyclase [Ensifer sp. LC13]OCP31111.1 diguanylate cyclase [Ensifer sp. LC499]
MVVAERGGRPTTADMQGREFDRLLALGHLDILDTPRDDGLDRVVRLIRQVFAIDIGIVSLVDAHRQWYKACSGLSFEEVPREDTFCRYVITSEEPLIVNDATKDPRFSRHPAVTGAEHIRFYAGVPLKTKDGHTVGTVCAIDRAPRHFADTDLAILSELAGVAMDRIDLLRSAATDGLTGALTRRAFRDEADKLISLAVRHQHDLSCIVLDVDHFKRVNDTHGHAAGDEVLKAVATICQVNLRASDLFGRLGGEEFAIMLPHVDAKGALAAAEKLRAAIAAQTIHGDFGQLAVTASFGTAALSPKSRDIGTLLAQADAAMYLAKAAGRNRCVDWCSLDAGYQTGPRERVLKAGTILYGDRHSRIDCTIRSLGADGAAVTVSNSSGIPPELVLIVAGDGLETKCRVVARDRQNLELAFG